MLPIKATADWNSFLSSAAGSPSPQAPAAPAPAASSSFGTTAADSQGASVNVNFCAANPTQCQNGVPNDGADTTGYGNAVNNPPQPADTTNAIDHSNTAYCGDANCSVGDAKECSVEGAGGQLSAQCSNSPTCKALLSNPATAGAGRDCVNACVASGQSCLNAANSANPICPTETSPILLTAAAYASAAFAATDLLSTSSSCQTSNNVMSDIKMALAAYNVACGAMAMQADTACNAPNPAFVSTQIHKLCQSNLDTYKWNIGAGLASLGTSLLKGKSSGDSCQSAVTQSGTNAIDCTQAANQSNQVCICQAYPNAAGCSVVAQSCTCTAAGACTCTTPSNVAATGTPVPPSGTLSTTSGTTTTTSTNSGVLTAAGTGLPTNPSVGGTTSSGSTGASVLAGSAPMGQGGVAASSGTTGSTGSVKANAMNATDSGAGSGTYSSGGGGGALGVQGAAVGPYAQFLPGGAKYQARSPAATSAANVAAEIRGAGSDDNFTQISKRYQTFTPDR